MGFKIIAFINTVLLIGALGLGGFYYQQNEARWQRADSGKVTMQNEILKLKEMQDELGANPIFKLGLHDGDSLKFENETLTGLVDVEAHLVVAEKEVLAEPVEVLVLAYKNPTDVSLNEYVALKTKDQAEMFDVNDDFHFMPIGCMMKNEILADSIKIEDVDLIALKESSPENLVKVRLFFQLESSFKDVCSSGISNLMVVK